MALRVEGCELGAERVWPVGVGPVSVTFEA
jgi:hypothetical protein